MPLVDTDHPSRSGSIQARFSELGPRADDIDLNPYPTKPRLTFRSDGTFKITVFSDLHYGENPWDDWGLQQDIDSTSLMNTVLDSETPDYVFVASLAQGENLAEATPFLTGS